MQNKKFWWVLGLLVVSFSGCGGYNRLYQLDSSENGYAMYRSGQPGDEDIEEWCRVGVRRIYALNGQGSQYAAKLAEKCPQAEIVYDQQQEPNEKVSEEFLAEFDAKVALAKAEGSKILFHCNCGCHRTGRLAAYYRMKYQGWPADSAISEMNMIGKNMQNHPSLPDQVIAMEDYIQNRTCSLNSTSNQRLCLNNNAVRAASPPDATAVASEPLP